MKNHKIKLKKGDRVIVLRGKDKHKIGQVTAVHPKLNKVTVDGVNVVTRHQKPTEFRAGGIVELTKPVWVSKVALIDPSTGKPSRVGWRLDDNQRKERYFKKSGQTVPKPNLKPIKK